MADTSSLEKWAQDPSRLKRMARYIEQPQYEDLDALPIEEKQERIGGLRRAFEQSIEPGNRGNLNLEFAAKHPDFVNFFQKAFSPIDVATSTPWVQRFGQTGAEAMTAVDNPEKVSTGNPYGDLATDLAAYLLAFSKGAPGAVGGAPSAAAGLWQGAETGVGKVLSKVPKYNNLTNLMQTAIKTGATAVPYEMAVATANERELSGREGALAAGSNFLLSALIGKATGGGRLFNPMKPQAQRTPVAGAPQPIHEEGVVGTGAMSNVDKELAGISVGTPPPPKVGAKDPIGDMHRQAQAEAKAAEAIAKAQYGPTPAAPQPLPQQKVKLVDFGTRTKQVDDVTRKSYADKAQAIEQYWGTRQYTRTDEGFTIKGTEKTRNAYEQNVMAAAKKAAIAKEAFENVSLNKEPHESAFALIDDMWRKITKTSDARAELETLGYKGFKEESLQQYNDAFQLAETLGIAPENITGKVLKEHFGWKQNVANDIARQIRDDINFENDLAEGQRIYEARIKEQT
ncbi:MAG: hypothetical protein PHR07_09150, partial [Acidaminococcaceae bacterium]|nr:hypothetical protein [Acidaminococcaceae bacterium]